MRRIKDMTTFIDHIAEAFFDFCDKIHEFLNSLGD